MHITKIELEDIKSHAHFLHEFQRGTTAIMGENGAGKTTLIEAVAWTLFDLLDYKKDDFVRRGAKKGIARVSFESGLDEREYTIYRDSGTGYYVYDPQLKIRIADKKEEVTRFLWQHLGVEPGTDLESLFRRAIGVPQGTFTAIFLESPAERKKAFDRLLKVEEYRQGADKLLETSRYIDSQIMSAREKIARAEGELSRIESLESEHSAFSKESGEFETELAKLEAQLKEKTALVETFEAKEKRFKEVEAKLEKLRSEQAKAGFVAEQKQKERDLAAAAAENLTKVESDHKKHLEALGTIKELERERGERDKLNVELRRVESAQAKVAADQKNVAEKLDAALKAHREIKELEPKAAEQRELEKEFENLRNALAKADAAESAIKSLDTKVADLRKKYSANQAEIAEAEKHKVEAESLIERQKRDQELTASIASFRAKLETDQKFQEQIRGGFCPILSAKCLNLAEGQTLDSFVNDQFKEVTAEIGKLEAEQRTLAAAIKTAREAERFSSRLETLYRRRDEIKDEGTKLNEEKAALESSVSEREKIKAQFDETGRKLKEIGNAAGRIELLKKNAESEILLRDERTKIEKNLERLQNDHGILVEQLESYKFLDSNWKEAVELRDKTIEAHRTYLVSETAAKSLPEKEKELAEAVKSAADLQLQVEVSEKEKQAAAKDYDSELHTKEKLLLREFEQRSAETRVKLENAKKRAAEIAKELERLAAVRKSMQADFAAKERLEKIGEATKFIRDTLKEAAPRVAQNYVFHVAIEANQMFREITGNAERTLKWSDDYGILLEEGGYDRPFLSLSGGEQMAAALSVRLALLKQLSDIRIAFFDEPTTNMDVERRERLAEQISRITEKQTFDQLFVISHDDTFEGYVDNVVTLETDAVG